MTQLFNCLLVVVTLIIFSEKLSLASDSQCSQKQCVNITSNCLLSFPMSFSSHTIVTFCSEYIYIDMEMSICNKTDVTLQSVDNGHTNLVCNHSAVGFKFINVTNLHISSITFDGCGLILDTKELDNTLIFIKAGLLISHCENVTIDDVTVKNSAGCGLVFNQTSGTIQIVQSSFEANGERTTDSLLAVAGGLYIEFVHRNTENNNETVTSMYSIDDCRFVNNWCHVPAFRDGIGTSTKYQGFGQGGGLTLRFKNNASSNRITIKNCEFSGNTALWGGGMRMHYLNSPTNNTVVIQCTRFIKNRSLYSGGGTDVEFAVHDVQASMWNIAKFRNCKFVENIADQYGGGIRMYSSRNKFIVMNTSFSNCSFSTNKAMFGPAVDMLPQSLDVYNNGFLSSVLFYNCNFTSNKVIKMQIGDNHSKLSAFKHYESGKGVFACADFFIDFRGKIIFENNTGSAMYLSSCRIQFECGSYVHFYNNTGYDGGAIVLFGESVLYIKDNSSVVFVNNTAVRRGGAIMHFSSNEHEFLVYKSCFIQYLGDSDIDERSIKFIFLNNKAVYGQAIFASTLRPCQRLCVYKQDGNVTVHDHTSVNESFRCIGSFNFSEGYEKQISTSGEHLTSNLKLSTSIPVIPGRELTLEFNMTDELYELTYDTFHVSIEDNVGGNVSIDPAYTYVSERKVVKLYGKPGGSAQLILTNAEFQPVVVTAHIEMKHCPPGFVLDESSDAIKCVCSADTQSKTYTGITSCNSRKRVAYVQSGYYVGYNNLFNLTKYGTEEELITGQCPRGFCQYDLKSSNHMNKIGLPENNSIFQVDHVVCGQERTGKLCGKCRSHHSVFFHSTSYRCFVNNHTCKLSFLIYFVSELLPVTILFLVVIFYDIQFTAGSLNSLLFYFQMIDALVIDVKGIVQPHIAVTSIMKANQLIYGIFNLDFFTLDELSYCLWSTASTLDILAFKYVTITYSLILIIITVVLMKFCNPSKIRKVFRCSKEQFSVKTSIIHGLVAFLVICYAQNTKVSLSILTPGHIHWIGPPKDHNISTVVYYEGDVSFMHTQHLKYAIPAIFFLITFTIIPPVLLMIYPLCYKVFTLLKLEETSFTHFLCMFVPLEKLKPLFDSFQGSFKDNYRFFAGLFFLYRFSALLLYAVTDSVTLFYTLLEIQLVVTLILHALVQPYKLHSHNMIDIALLGLLALINAMTMYNYQKAYRGHRSFQHETNSVTSLQLFLIFFPLVYLAMYFLKKIIEKRTANVLKRKEKESGDHGLTDTLSMVDFRERNYSDFSGPWYHRF